MKNAIGNPTDLKKFCKKIDIPFLETAGPNYLSYWVREHIRLNIKSFTTEPMDIEPTREECQLSVINNFIFYLLNIFIHPIGCLRMMKHLKNSWNLTRKKIRMIG